MRHKRRRLDPVIPQAAQGEGFDPLRQFLTSGADQQREVSECDPAAPHAQRFGQIDMDPGSGHAVFGADHVGHTDFEIVHHGGERVERRAVRADHHRVRKACEPHPPRTVDQIVPCYLPVREQNAPVGALASGLSGPSLLRSHLQHRPVIDRGLLPLDPELTLPRSSSSLSKQGSFEARIETPGGFQPPGCGGVQVHPVRLPDENIPLDSHPPQVMLYCLGEFRAAALGVRVVEAKQKPPAATPREQVVGQCGAAASHMQQSGRAGREPEERGHSSSPEAVSSSSSSPMRRGSIDRQSRSSSLAGRSTKSPNSLALRQPSSLLFTTSASSP